MEEVEPLEGKGGREVQLGKLEFMRSPEQVAWPAGGSGSVLNPASSADGTRWLLCHVFDRRQTFLSSSTRLQPRAAISAGERQFQPENGPETGWLGHW